MNILVIPKIDYLYDDGHLLIRKTICYLWNSSIDTKEIRHYCNLANKVFTFSNLIWKLYVTNMQLSHFVFYSLFMHMLMFRCYSQTCTDTSSFVSFEKEWSTFILIKLCLYWIFMPYEKNSRQMKCPSTKPKSLV